MSFGPTFTNTGKWSLCQPNWSASFEVYRNPTPEPVELLDNITWPTVSTDNFVYLNINNTLELKDTPKSPRYNVWRDVFEEYGVRPLIVF